MRRAMQEIEITFDTRKEAARALSDLRRKGVPRPPSHRRLRALRLLIAGLAMVPLLVDPSLPLLTLGIVIGLVAEDVLRSWVKPRMLAAEAPPVTPGPLTLRLSADGVRAQGPSGTVEMGWHALPPARWNGSGMILSAGPDLAWPIPAEQLPDRLPPAALAAQIDAWRA